MEIGRFTVREIFTKLSEEHAGSVFRVKIGFTGRSFTEDRSRHSHRPRELQTRFSRMFLTGL